MKHGKNPTRRQKAKLESLRLAPDMWLICKDCRHCLEVVHRVTGAVRKLEAQGGKRVG